MKYNIVIKSSYDNIHAILANIDSSDVMEKIEFLQEHFEFENSTPDSYELFPVEV